MVVLCSACQSGEGRPPTTPTSVTSTTPTPTLPATASTPTTSTSSPTAATSSPTAANGTTCTTTADLILVAAQDELHRLDPLPFSSLVEDDSATDLSDDYKVLVRKAQTDAQVAGCGRELLSRRLLESSERLVARGPVAIATKANLVEALASNIASALGSAPPIDDVSVEVVGLVAPTAQSLVDCVAVGRAWIALHQALIDAVGIVPLDRYLRGDTMRSVDLRQNADNVGLRFTGTELDASIEILNDRGDELGCTDETLARALIEDGDTLRATTPTGVAFKADQITTAELLVIGF